MPLQRQLRLIDVFSVASGAMISSGIFILPGLAHAMAGPAVVISYLLAGLLAVTGLVSIAEMATAMPKAGGDYFFTTRSMGPAVGTVAGLMTWLSLSLKSAFALVGMSEFAIHFVNLDIRVIGVALCALFVWINLIGVREASRVQNALVAGLLGLMFLYVAVGLPRVQAAHFTPFAPRGMAGVFGTAGFVFVSYGGLLKVSSLSEEVRDPGRVIPAGLALSLGVAVAAYTLMVFVTSGILGAAQLDHSLTPISDGAGAILGMPGRIALSLAAILAFVSTANAGIMAGSRYLLALSRDNLLPDAFGRVSEKHRTPHVAVLCTGALIAAALFLPLEVLVKAASAVLILAYMAANLSVIILRESRLHNYQPLFRAPLYPWLQIAGALGFAFLLFEMGPEALWIALAFVALGLFIYWFYGRIKSTQEYALLHLIERITDRELTSGLMESELKEIIRERDEIVTDAFDDMVEKAAVLDLAKGMEADEFFGEAAKALAGQLALTPETLLRRLRSREKEGSTAISPSVAIPHIVVADSHGSSLLLARCREGIRFSEAAPGVRAVFVLAGARSDRSRHLRTLAAIAQIVQDPAFEKRWLAARDAQALRDTILLGKRRREPQSPSPAPGPTA